MDKIAKNDNKKVLPKRKINAIKKLERQRLEKFLQDAPDSCKGAVDSIVEELIDTKVLMAQAKAELEVVGVTEVYTNGANQQGTKLSTPFKALTQLQSRYAILHGRLVSLIVATLEGDDED